MKKEGGGKQRTVKGPEHELWFPVRKPKGMSGKRRNVVSREQERGGDQSRGGKRGGRGKS